MLVGQDIRFAWHLEMPEVILLPVATNRQKRKPKVREEEHPEFTLTYEDAVSSVGVRHLTRRNGKANKVEEKDKRFHEWYRFVLSYPPHLVRDYIKQFSLQDGDVLLDPFCGCGTTLVEGKLAGLKTVGVEANPFACFASKVKTDWDVDADG